MRAAEIRSRFLAYFERQGHAVRPSSSLVPADDPTLLFTNSGMVQFKKVFLGLEQPGFGRRATTAQKCVRAGGKHNDLEQVGHTFRHHTFFEMLGNFSFGDYFKRDAIAFAWEFVTKELGFDPKLIRVSVYHEDEEARALWREIAGLPDSRIYGLGSDNFWQMADTGPCGPCTEIFVDLAHLAKDWRFPANAAGEEWAELDRAEFSKAAFVEGTEAGRFLEIWNLVFMQYDRQPDGELRPLPKPSVDTGAGLERISAALQGVTSNFHTDVFAPLLARVEEVVGVQYWGRESDEIRASVMAGTGPSLVPLPHPVDPGSFRVLADHARAVAFLLADGVIPSNEGRGYVLRRILRRGVRHAWLLGRAEPTLAHLVGTVISTMGDAYPELRARARYITDATRAEEEAFLATIDKGMARFEQLAPAHTTQGATELKGTLSGEDAFRLYDTYGFPIDLTELMARERGYTVDVAGFERALEAQRAQSKEERRGRRLGVAADELGDPAGWQRHAEHAAPEGGLPEVSFVGYDAVEIETQVVAVRHLADGRLAVLLRETPFYAESGGQISDQGEIEGEGWRLTVDEVRKVEGRPAAVGTLEGQFAFGRVTARVPTERRRDTERNHTATHLLHAALRQVLGEHVHQAGSLVAPDRLRFDFTHHGPVPQESLERIEEMVNREIWQAAPVQFRQMAYRDALAQGAMALFSEKYGDTVRVVAIPGFSMELCGGTHVRNTSEIGLFKIVAETGIGSGQRRIEAATGRGAFELLRQRERTLQQVTETLGARPDSVLKRAQALVDERRALERRLEEALRGGGDQVKQLLARATQLDGTKVVAEKVSAADTRELQALGDALREQIGSGVAVIAASFPDGKNSLLAVVSEDVRKRGLTAGALVRELAGRAGGRGGGKDHMAQAGIPDAARIPDALGGVVEVVRSELGL